MTVPRTTPGRIKAAARRLVVLASLTTLASAPLGVALAHERLKPTLDEAARAGGALFETLTANAPGAHTLSLNGSRFALSTSRSDLPPRAAADDLARSCSQRSAGAFGVALGTDSGAVASCITLSDGFSPAAQVIFARPIERGAALLLVEPLDPHQSMNLLATKGTAEHLPGLPHPVGRLTLGAALDGIPLLAMYRAPHAQLDALQERLEARGARTRRGGKDALYADFAGRQYLLVESTERAETWLVVLRLPD